MDLGAAPGGLGRVLRVGTAHKQRHGDRWGAIHVWVKSSTPDVDLQATVSEVRPDGNETFVQNGWIRGSERRLAETANNLFKQKPTLLQPIPTMLASDKQPMPAESFVPVTI